MHTVERRGVNMKAGVRPQRAMCGRLDHEPSRVWSGGIARQTLL